jgi:hypothetical protein
VSERASERIRPEKSALQFQNLLLFLLFLLVTYIQYLESFLDSDSFMRSLKHNSSGTGRTKRALSSKMT